MRGTGSRRAVWLFLCTVVIVNLIRFCSFAEETFSSNLPLLILEEQDGAMQAIWLDDEGGRNSVADIVSDTPRSSVVLEERIKDDVQSEKPDYMLRAEYPEQGETRWFLDGMQNDRSYIRNMSALETAGNLFPDVPKPRYCEVLKKEQGRGGAKTAFSYLGLYLIREQPQECRTKLDEAELLNVNEILQSEEYSIYARYQKLFDTEAVIDYFALQECLLNDAESWQSAYLYRSEHGKIRIGTDWEFGRCLDGGKEPADLQSFTAVTHPWLAELFKDPAFIRKVQKRYRRLRKDVLGAETFFKTADGAAEQICEAAARDAELWRQSDSKSVRETEASTGLSIRRTQDSWEREVTQVKDRFFCHNQYLDRNLISLHEAIRFYGAKKTSSGLAVLFLFSFFASVIVVQRWRR